MVRSGRRTPKIKMSVTYQYTFGVEQQRALHILTMMLGAAAERCRQQPVLQPPNPSPRMIPAQSEIPPQYPTCSRQVSDKLALLKFCMTPRSIREMLPF